MKERVLVIGAHCDDESFGCLGTLLKHKEAGDSIEFLWFTDGRNCFDGSLKVHSFFNSTHSRWLRQPDQKLELEPLITWISHIEARLESVKPTIVYCPFIADLNRDHRIVSEATMVACRPYKPNAPREVWMFQIPGSTELGLREFHKDRTVEIDANKKYELIKKWYPGELINGRNDFYMLLEEHFERWPR